MAGLLVSEDTQGQKPSLRTASGPLQSPRTCPNCGKEYPPARRIGIPQESRRPLALDAYVCSACGRVEFYEPAKPIGVAPGALPGAISGPGAVRVQATPASMAPALKVAQEQSDPSELCRTDLAYVKQHSRRRYHVMEATLGGIVAGFGVVTYGALAWPAGLAFSNQVPIGVGAYIVGVSALGYFLVGRGLRRRIVSARLVPEGVQAVLQEGTTIVASWKDPKFALDCLVRPQQDRSPPVSYVLMWPMDRRVSAGELTAQGMARLLEAARNQGLEVSEKPLGKGPSSMELREVRAPGQKNPAPRETKKST